MHSDRRVTPVPFKGREGAAGAVGPHSPQWGAEHVPRPSCADSDLQSQKSQRFTGRGPHRLPMEKLPPMKPVPGAKKAGDRGVTGPVEGEGEGSQVKYGTACI